MGVLDNTTITVDAILTKKGRELLAQGEGKFKITKFALADDEIDYGLYDITHPNGSNFYGQAIENMNLLEAIPNQTLAVKYFLTNNPGQSSGNSPIVTLTGPTTIKATKTGIYQASTDNFANELYDFVLSSTQYASIVSVPQQRPPVEQEGTDPGAGLGSVSGYGSSGGSGGGSSTSSIRGTSITIRAKAKAVLGNQDRQVVLTATGVDSGKIQTLTINLQRD
jgi:hypothetical protein|tara:strand:+ start:284 stop:952 length:669 start_codon:yes stop_codon:yes gene_type:complete